MGNQQKVLVARWLAADSDLLLLDEPTRGIDVAAKFEIYEIIDELAKKGCGILVVSSELPELIGLCDRNYCYSCWDSYRCICNLVSAFFVVNRPQMQPAYNASKAAVHHLTKSLAAEWAPKGVRVNAIAPGYIKTAMSPVDDPRFRRMWIEDAPMQRYGMPEELGPAVVFLASEAASFVTGSVLVIDGGYTAY